MNELEFAQQFKPEGPVTAAGVLARHLATPDPQELREAAEAQRAAAAAESLRETRAMLNAMNGDPLGHLARAQAQAASARDVVRDLEDQLATARQRLERAAGAMVDFGAQADEVLSRSAQQAGTQDLLGEAKRALAEYRVEQMLARAAASPAVTRAGRPFGAAARSEPVTCPECLAAGATPEESLLLHLDPAPLPVPAVPSEAETDWRARRHAYSGSREIVR